MTGHLSRKEEEERSALFEKWHVALGLNGRVPVLALTSHAKIHRDDQCQHGQDAEENSPCARLADDESNIADTTILTHGMDTDCDSANDDEKQRNPEDCINCTRPGMRRNATQYLGFTFHVLFFPLSSIWIDWKSPRMRSKQVGKPIVSQSAWPAAVTKAPSAMICAEKACSNPVVPPRPQRLLRSQLGPRDLHSSGVESMRRQLISARNTIVRHRPRRLPGEAWCTAAPCAVRAGTTGQRRSLVNAVPATLALTTLTAVCCGDELFAAGR